MKELLLGVVILILVGVAGFFYRNALEHPAGSGGQVACSADAKMCPDGTGVGRVGPSCAFAPCPLPNAEDAAIGIAFVVPKGFVANADAIGADETLRAVFDAPGSDTIPDSIIIRDYPIKTGSTSAETILANTMYESSGNQPKSMKEFAAKVVNGRTFQSLVVERFEAQVHSIYYLVRDKDVLRFEVIERGVKDWMEPTLKVETLPHHQSLLQMLGTLQTS